MAFSSTDLLQRVSLLHDDDGQQSGEDPDQRGRVPNVSRLQEVRETRHRRLAQLKEEAEMEASGVKTRVEDRHALLTFPTSNVKCQRS